MKSENNFVNHHCVCLEINEIPKLCSFLSWVESIASPLYSLYWNVIYLLVCAKVIKEMIILAIRVVCIETCEEFNTRSILFCAQIFS